MSIVNFIENGIFVYNEFILFIICFFFFFSLFSLIFFFKKLKTVFLIGFFNFIISLLNFLYAIISVFNCKLN